MEITGREILELLQKLIKVDEKFSIEQDYYWDISADKIYNVYEKPEDLTIGQLSEDWKELQELLTDQRDAIPFHDLAHFSQIVKAIAGEKLN